MCTWGVTEKLIIAFPICYIPVHTLGGIQQISDLLWEGGVNIFNTMGLQKCGICPYGIPMIFLMGSLVVF